MVLLVAMSCPCGSLRPADACCAPFLERRESAPTAEALMRSRYTAFVRGAVDYLLDTHDATTRNTVERAAVERWSREATWLGLEIVATERGGVDDDSGIVEFRARYREGGVERLHHERSRFHRVDGQWRYLDGDSGKPRPAVRSPTAGRNDPCPCGSGRKFKKCCGG